MDNIWEKLNLMEKVGVSWSLIGMMFVLFLPSIMGYASSQFDISMIYLIVFFLISVMMALNNFSRRLNALEEKK